MGTVPLNHLLKIGAEALQTSAQTLCGAVNEIRTQFNTFKNTADTSINSITSNLNTLIQNYNTHVSSNNTAHGTFQNDINVIRNSLNNKLAKDFVIATLADVLASNSATTVPSTKAIIELNTKLTNYMYGKTLWENTNSNYTIPHGTTLKGVLNSVKYVEIIWKNYAGSTNVYTTGRVPLSTDDKTTISLKEPEHRKENVYFRAVEFKPDVDEIYLGYGYLKKSSDELEAATNGAVPMKIIGYYE